MSKTNYQCVLGSLETGRGWQVKYFDDFHFQHANVWFKFNSKLSPKIFKQDLYYYTLLGNTESKPCRDLQSGVSFCYKIRPQMVPSKVEITLTLQVIRHLLLSHFRTKGLISKLGLSFSISLPSVLGTVHSVVSSAIWVYFLNSCITWFLKPDPKFQNLRKQNYIYERYSSKVFWEEMCVICECQKRRREWLKGLWALKRLE